MTKRSGKTLAVLPDGAPRRMADGKNAWRKMNSDQRWEFLVWIAAEDGVVRGASPGVWLLDDRFCLISYGREELAVCDDCGERGELTGHDECRGKS